MDIKTLYYVLFVLLSLNITACDFRTPEQIADEDARIQAEKENRLTNEEGLQFANMKFDHNKYRVLKRANRFFLVPDGWDIGDGVVPAAGQYGFGFSWFPAGSSCPRTWRDINELSPECKLAAEKSNARVFILSPKKVQNTQYFVDEPLQCEDANGKYGEAKTFRGLKWKGLYVVVSDEPDYRYPHYKDEKDVCKTAVKILNQIIEIK